MKCTVTMQHEVLETPHFISTKELSKREGCPIQRKIMQLLKLSKNVEEAIHFEEFLAFLLRKSKRILVKSFATLANVLRESF